MRARDAELHCGCGDVADRDVLGDDEHVEVGAHGGLVCRGLVTPADQPRGRADFDYVYEGARAVRVEGSFLDGSPLRYGKPGFENPHFVASGDGAD